MKHVIAAALALSVVASPSWAEDDTSLMEEGAKLFFRGLMEEMEPALKELEGLAEEIEPRLQDFVDGIGPTLEALLNEVEDWSAYEPPVVLPNGDILLKRKPDTSEPDALTAPGEGEIDI